MIHGLLGASPGSLFAQMDNSQNDFFVGDVKYHLGRSATLEYPPVRHGPAGFCCLRNELLCQDVAKHVELRLCGVEQEHRTHSPVQYGPA